ncbi:MAG: hypothetical protein ABII90_01440 [Bacteroidota bacterium]
MKKNSTEFESPEQIVGVTADSLAQAAANYAFRLFRDKKFRELARFGKLSQTEQDRIFNELVLAYLILTMLVHEAPDLRIPEGFHNYLKGLNNKIPDAYLKILRDLGIEAKHLRDWKKLINMRYDEYAQDRHEVRAAAMKIESSQRGLDMDSLTKIQMTVPVSAVAIGCHHHICRSKTKGYDDLFKYLMRTLSRFYVKYRVRIEGGKITLLTRVFATLVRLSDRIYKSISW